MSNERRIAELKREIARLEAGDAKRVAAGRVHPCPQCKTTGRVDSKTETELVDGFVEEICVHSGFWPTGRMIPGKVKRPKKVTCTLCEGHGYTKVPAKPRTAIVGWDLGE